MGTRLNISGIALLLSAVMLCSCVHRLTMHARDGEKLDGRWRFAREGGGLIEVVGRDGEVLIGALKPVARGTFFENYRQAFGSGSIAAEGPDLSVYGNGLWSPPGSTNALVDMAHGENFDPAAKRSHSVISGPLFFWTAMLEGDRRSQMHCFLIGSARSARGLGRCKGSGGKEYTVEF